MSDSIYARLHIGRIREYTGESILSYTEVLILLNHVRAHKDTIILGGDVLNENDEYTYENWYYDRNDALSFEENVDLSCQVTLAHLSGIINKENMNYILVLE